MVIRGLSKYDVFQLNAIAAKRFFWVFGHGRTLSEQPESPDRVPANTWVIFLSKPGRYLNADGFISSDLFMEKFRKQTSLVRNLILGLIPEERIPLSLRIIHPKYWAKQLYCPGDAIPSTGISMLDEAGLELDEICGVNDTSNPTDYPVYPKFHGRRPKISTLLKESGPGIYFIVACRHVSTQSQEALKKAFNAYVECGFQRSSQRASNNTGLISRLERNNSARRACQLIRPLLVKVPVTKKWKEFKNKSLNPSLVRTKILRKRNMLLSRLQ